MKKTLLLLTALLQLGSVSTVGAYSVPSETTRIVFSNNKFDLHMDIELLNTLQETFEHNAKWIEKLDIADWEVAQLYARYSNLTADDVKYLEEIGVSMGMVMFGESYSKN